jgi:hypothetical protein
MRMIFWVGDAGGLFQRTNHKGGFFRAVEQTPSHTASLAPESDARVLCHYALEDLEKKLKEYRDLLWLAVLSVGDLGLKSGVTHVVVRPYNPQESHERPPPF